MPLQSISTRMVALMGLMLQLLILAHYTSDLFSSLTAGPQPPSISTLRDIYNNPSLEIGFIEGASIQIYFSVSFVVIL